MKRIVVAMSGGVDSSVAALHLKEEGYDVIGLTMHLWDFEEVGGRPPAENRCCSLEAINDARRVCHSLGIPHYVMDLRRAFKETVLRNFVREYLKGRTPNPCVLCNTWMKWDLLLRKAQALEACQIATGHYAKVERREENGPYLLRKGVDQEKDQSYVLWGLTQDKLARTLLPLGRWTKKETREIARRSRLKTADKRASQEICFVPDDNYRRFIRARARAEGIRSITLEEGPIRDGQGNVLGVHRGVAFYTVGQRRGLGIAVGKPLYVTRIDPQINTLWVGEEKHLRSKGLVVSGVNWIAIPGLTEDLPVEVKIRYLHRPAPAVIAPLEEGRVAVKFDEPQKAVTPGQSAVFYREDIVVGGGIIAQAL